MKEKPNSVDSFMRQLLAKCSEDLVLGGIQTGAGWPSGGNGGGGGV